MEIEEVRCNHCGKLFNRNDVHMIYAMVGGGLTDVSAMELCPECTDLMDPSKKESYETFMKKYVKKCGKPIIDDRRPE